MHRVILNATSFRILVPLDRKKQFVNTCFRGGESFAGSFAYWNSFHELFSDQRANALMTSELASVLEVKNSDGFACLSMDYGSPIGWPQAMPEHELPEGEIVEGNLKGYAKRHSIYLPEDENFHVPPTSLIAMEVRFLWVHKDEMAIHVLSLYPGPVLPLAWRDTGSELVVLHSNIKGQDFSLAMREECMA